MPFLLALLHPSAVPWLHDRVFGLLGRAPLALGVHLRDSARASAWAMLAFIVFGVRVAIVALAMDGGGLSTVLRRRA